ncbi:hypothetical protein B0H14DRAFT_2581553 [Mycena olivaceomarginata]|nr:hypothetical protein B0H14DRAFT_2581553 [Mycena olivaceomarginata]
MTSKNGLNDSINLVFDQAQRRLLQIGSIVELLSDVRTRASTRNLNRRYNVRNARPGSSYAACAPYKSAADDTGVRNYTSEQASRCSEDNNNTEICDVEMMAVDRAS